MTHMITPSGDTFTFSEGLQTTRRLDPDVVAAGLALKISAMEIDRLQTLWMPRNADRRRKLLNDIRQAVKVLERMP